MKIGYARVSSKDQNLDRQLVALQNEGCEKIYQDKCSGKDLNRPEFQKMLSELNKGDLVVICSLDRLSRNYDETSAQWQNITIDRECDIKVLDMPILDTTVKTNALTSKVITNIVIQLLAYCSNVEREKIRERQAQGIEIARSKGVRFGRSIKISKEQFLYHYDRFMNGSISVSQICKKLDISRKTFYNLKDRYLYR